MKPCACASDLPWGTNQVLSLRHGSRMEHGAYSHYNHRLKRAEQLLRRASFLGFFILSQENNFITIFW